MRRAVVLGIVAAAGRAIVLAQPVSVVDGPHNLSATGSGPIRATMEDQVCIFCHAPHNSTPIRPLWNRFTPIEAYRIYTSRSLDAEPGQPTGASKMCLSCHDGTIALGSIVSRDRPIQMSGAPGALAHGASNLGTDLSDDHPISFRYDAALAARDRRLRDPSLLPSAIRLDVNQELQCTSCHDAHDNAYGNFLVMPNDSSQLCSSCHQVGTTTIHEHANCNTCHQPHTAPSGPYLLKRPTVTDTCLACHDGSQVGVTDVASELRRSSVHDTQSVVSTLHADAAQSTCTDCHEPHSMDRGAAEAPGIHPNFGRIDGVTESGTRVSTASHEYEVCFKCHADTNAIRPSVSRLLPQNNTRLEFGSNPISAHPVVTPGHAFDVPSLVPTLTASTMIGCSDCHGSNVAQDLGTIRAHPVHGSNDPPLLIARYRTDDYTSESAQAYDLCYRCHIRSNILSDQSFPYHQEHIVNQRTPCSACHDAHGISSAQGSPMGNTHLINFDSFIVRPDGVTGRLEFRDTGRFAGECFLSCHGTSHSPATYGR
jgi:predicted CXXCH cytochrome family protein